MVRRIVWIALWLGAVGAVAAAPKPPAETECDRLAALRYDADLPKRFVVTDTVDWKAAIPACRKALHAAPWNRRLRFELGRALELAGSYREAKAEYVKAAHAGSATAMRNLGQLYESGEGLPKDYAAARLWYKRAAANGDVGGMINLGLLYKIGLGVPKDYAAARRWFKRAASVGAAPAMTNLGTLSDDGQGVPRN